MDTLVYEARITGYPKNICIVYAQFSRQQRGTEKKKYFQRLTDNYIRDGTPLISGQNILLPIHLILNLAVHFSVCEVILVLN